MACLLFDCPADNIVQQILELVLLAIAIFTIGLFGPKVLAYCLSLVVRICKPNPLKPLHNDYAIITGASDGIGLEYSRQLAKKGYQLLLLSRTQSKLDAVRNEILDKCSIDVQIMAVDFTNVDIYDSIREKIKLLPGRVAVLINNVGMMNSTPQELGDIVNPDYNLRLVTCNTIPVMKMCEITLPIMKEQKYGVVVNISSSMGIVRFPYFAAYCATKAFVSALTQCVATEYGAYGIIFQDLTPNQVETNMSKTIHNSVYSVPAPSYVRYALNSIGKEYHTSAHPKHKIMNNSMELVNFWLPRTFGQQLFKVIIRNLGKKTSQSKVHP